MFILKYLVEANTGISPRMQAMQLYDTIRPLLSSLGIYEMRMIYSGVDGDISMKANLFDRSVQVRELDRLKD